MCGIAGYFAPHPLPVEAWRPRLDQSIEVMTPRGPDDHGVYQADRVGLGHRRLSIIDLSGGRQPLQDEVTGAVIVFNGEIYNYRALRVELEKTGRTFHTQSDTEVLLHAYQEWGSNCLDRLLGMFAFAVYTPHDGSLFLARDRLGIKPLYWSAQPEAVCFASSVRALLPLLSNAPSLNAEAVSHYLSTIRTNLGGLTLLHGVHLLEPGHCLRIERNGDARMQRYWTPACMAPDEKPERSWQEAQDELRALLTDAVRLRLISDVPLGGFLSGGIDSTVLAAHATELSDHHYHAYSVGYPQEGFHEFPYVDAAAKAYGMRCQKIELEANDYPDLWEGLIRQNGLPLSTPNEVPIYMLSKALKKDYTVALSGEGADEVFGGYTIAYFSGYDFDRAHRGIAPPEQEWSVTDRALARAYGQPSLPSLTRQHFLLNSYLSPMEKRRWLHPDVVRTLQQDAAMNAYYDQLFNPHPRASTLDRIMQAHLRVNLEGLLLRVDSSSMAASVEVRCPFTDHRLVDFAFSLPDAFRLDFRSDAARHAATGMNINEIIQHDLVESKRLLRRTYASEVPESILNRPKMSFPVPVFEWMNDWMKPRVREIIADSPLRHQLFNPESINAWLDGYRPLHPLKVWPLVNLCLWESTLR